MPRPFKLEQEKLRGPEAQTELIRDRHDPELRIVDRISDFSGGVNFRDYNLVEDNQGIELQNGYPADIFSGRKGYTGLNVTTSETTIAADTDDMHERLDTNDVIDGLTINWVGVYDVGSVEYMTAIQFILNVTQGEQIGQADLFLKFFSGGDGEAITIYCEDTDNADTLDASSDSDLSGRTTTSASTTVTPASGGGEYTTDVRELVQEVIDRPGFASGNRITFLLRKTSGLYAQVYARESGVSNSDPKLTYTSSNISETEVEQIYRYYEGTTNQHLLVAVNGSSNDKVYRVDDTGTSSELTGGTALTADQKYSFATYKDVCFLASENQDLQYSDDGTTKADCGGTLPATAGHLLTVHEDRLWNAGQSAAKNTVYYSASGVYTSDPASDMDFDGGGEINLNQGDGDFIIAMIPFHKILYVFKRNYVVQIFGNSRFNFEAAYPPIYKGCVGYKALTRLADLVYFVSWDGVYSMDAGGNLENVSVAIEPIFRNEADVTEWNINKTHLDKSVLFAHDNFIWLSYPSGASTVPDKVIIYDPLRRGWFPQKGMDINCAISQTGYDDEYELRTGSASSGYVWKMNTGSTDNGSDIEFVYRTKFRDQKMPERSKQYMSVVVDLDTGETASVSAWIDVDETALQQYTLTSTEVGLPWGSFNWGEAYWSKGFLLQDPISVTQPLNGKKISARFSYTSDSSRLKIRNCTFVAEPEMLRQ